MIGQALERLLPSLCTTKIAVAGDFCLDAYWHLDNEPAEVSVETGLPAQRVQAQRYSPGGAGNVVANLLALGVQEVRAIGVHGSDPFGPVMRALLADAGADVSGLHDLGPAWQTLVYAKPWSADGELPRIDFGTRGSVPDTAVSALLESITAAAAWAHVVVINQQVASCFAEPALVKSISAVIEAHPQALFVVDARNAAAAYANAILKVNVAEAAAMVDGQAAPGRAASDTYARELAEQIISRTGHPVFITRGERGIVAADHHGVHCVPGIEITRQIDPVGAGDTVVAAIAAVLASGGDVPTAAHIANIAASVTVRKIHTTGVVTARELTLAAERADHVYCPELADNPAQARYLPGTEIELIASMPADHQPIHVIFDHDGTLSTLRQGWEGVMEPMMIRAILGQRYKNADAEAFQRVRSAVRSFIDRTTGVQTLVQMQGLAEMVRRFEFVPEDEILDEHGYKEIYNAELLELLQRRLARLNAGHLDRTDFHVKNAIPFLRRLTEQGLTLYLASGTDREDVIEEAKILGFAEFFEDRIYGAVGDVRIEAKRVVLDRIFQENKLGAGNVVTFGDGPVEMRESRKRDAICVGVCSDEVRRYGFNPAKRSRLIRAGANILIPDFGDMNSILIFLGLR